MVRVTLLVPSHQLWGSGSKMSQPTFSSWLAEQYPSWRICSFNWVYPKKISLLFLSSNDGVNRGGSLIGPGWDHMIKTWPISVWLMGIWNQGTEIRLSAENWDSRLWWPQAGVAILGWSSSAKGMFIGEGEPWLADMRIMKQICRGAKMRDNLAPGRDIDRRFSIWDRKAWKFILQLCFFKFFCNLTLKGFF